MSEKYRGMHYPEPIEPFCWPRVFYWLWRRWFCRREYHLFSEVLTAGFPDFNHYLSCDACGLAVEIGKIKEPGEKFNL